LPPSASLRVLIFVVAHRAEATLVRVLDQIPAEVSERYDVHTLVIDDGSSDDTFGAGLSWAAHRDGSRVSVLQNPRPNGYGGNLKLGFEYAIAEGFDVVVLLHGDGKYAPSALPEMIRPIAAQEADVVIGTRFSPGAPRGERMPLHRELANRSLTWLQNRLLGSRFSDFHCAYRAYSVSALRRIPFRYATDELHIESELLIQLLRSECRIVEVPVPAYHGGSELGYPRGIAYAWRSLASTLASLLDSVGIKYRRKFDLQFGRPAYAPKLGYMSSHTMAIAEVPAGARVLDVGCGRGYVARELKAKGCRVTGLDTHEPDLENVSEFARWDLNREPIPVRVGDFDWLLLLDVIEHLERPERFLSELREAYELEGPTILLSTPNTGFLPMRIMLLLGQLNYGKEGILDFTHTRLLTLGTLRDLLDQSGYEVLEVRGVPAPFPKAIGVHPLSRALVQLNELAIRVSRRLFAYQLFLRIRPRPTVRNLLSATRTHSEVARRARGFTSGPSAR
jgi:glycosyltransferase involved in cell wall biosynthesis